MSLYSTPSIVVMIGMLIAAATDVRSFKVYNLLTLPMLAGGLIYHLTTAGMAGFSASVVGAAFGFGVLFFIYALGAMGAGDVKLAAAIGAWLGAGPLVPLLVLGLLFTALYSLVLLCSQRRLGDAWTSFQMSYYRLASISRHLLAGDQQENVKQIAQRSDRRARLVPFSLMLGLGFVATMLIREFL